MEATSADPAPTATRFSRWKLVLLLLFAAGAGLAVYVVAQPNQMSISRTAKLQAPVDRLFPLVNDFHAWQRWSPWQALDPNATAEFTGAASGEGAEFAWSGNAEVGRGKMTILKSVPNARVEMQLDFRQPMECTNFSKFEFEPLGNETQVTWTMTGENNVMSKLMGLFIDVDQMVGAQFEQGLKNLEQLALTDAAPVETLTVPPQAADSPQE